MKLYKKMIILLFTLSIFSVNSSTIASAFEDNIDINSETFPDPNFLECVKEYDLNNDNIFSLEERNSVLKLSISERNLTDLKGIEIFENLEYLNCNENSIKNLDLSQNIRLQKLFCNENPLETLNISNNINLTNLHCYKNKLTTLDLSNNINLIELNTGDTNIENLDISNNKVLQSIMFVGGKIKNLDLSNNKDLEMLVLNYTQIDNLDLSNNKKLSFLNCSNNELTSLDISNNPEIYWMLATNNKLLAIKFSSKEDITYEIYDQRPFEYSLPNSSNTLDINKLIPWFEIEKINLINGAYIENNIIKLNSPNITVEYNYTDGDKILNSRIQVNGENTWIENLKQEDWVYGEESKLPTAIPAFGNVDFSYSKTENGEYETDIPTHAGIWYVKSTVEGNENYSSLVDIVKFEIKKATPNYNLPETRTVEYGNHLYDVPLTEGFSWENSNTLVGNVGNHIFEVEYTPTDLEDYEIVKNIPLYVIVVPYDGTKLEINEIKNQEMLDNLKIMHNDYILIEGKDYKIEQNIDSNKTTITITFIGNYTGTVKQIYETNDNNSSNENNNSSSGNNNGTNTENKCIFDDVPKDSWYKDGVEFVCENGWIDSISKKYFAPNNNFNRGSFIIALYRINGQNYEDKVIFKDIPINSELSQAAAWGNENNLIVGYGDGYYGPYDPITREQAFVILYNYGKNKNIIGNIDKDYLTKFIDKDEITPYAIPACNWFTGENIIQGKPGNKFAPQDNITRGEVSVILKNYIEHITEFI